MAYRLIISCVVSAEKTIQITDSWTDHADRLNEDNDEVNEMLHDAYGLYI